MTKLKILLLGERGYLGSFLNRMLFADTNPKHNDYDYIINCIGKPNLEECQKHPDISRESNYNVVEKIIANYPKSKVIHFSSYYVYDDDGLCKENAKTTYKYNYTKDKLDSEKLVETNGVVFRVGKIFGNVYNNQNKFTEYIINEPNIVADDVMFNPTSTYQILDALNFEFKQRCLNGILNLGNAGISTHYEYAKFIENILGVDKNIKRVEKIERSFHNYGKFCMNCNRMSLYIKLRDWRDDMNNYLKRGHNVT